LHNVYRFRVVQYVALPENCLNNKVIATLEVLR